MSARPSTLASHVKGSALQTRVRWLQLEHGDPGMRRIAAQLDEELGEALDQGIRMSDWYEFQWFVDLNLALDRTYGSGDLALVRALGRHGADAHLTTIYRLFYKVGKVKWLLARAARLWGLHYDTGQLLVREFPGQEVELEIANFATPHRVHCLAVQGWAERSVELSGGEEVATRELSCRASGDDRCRFRLAWR